MSQNLDVRRTVPVYRRIKPPHPSMSSHKSHRKVAVRRSLNKQSKFIKRCNSEPILLTSGISIIGDGVGGDHQYMTPPGDSCLLSRSRISTNIFLSSPELLPNNSPDKSEAYNKESKVVIKVTVEGSVGPIRALVKLGSSVDETIKLVINKYKAERRSPRLDQDDMTCFELHQSYFSLKCFDKSNMIGELGSRSFYMRKSVNSNGDRCSNTSIDSEISVAEADEAPYACSNIFSSFIHERLRKMLRRMSKIRWFLGCFGG
ncbi:hypothetical protein M8C21_014889 [Ambrosia artemisiifolia]|uniref:DUF7054 domain-containing protein n=1 Tax=Ambrosia artemisiifolia TaxID=4212 RepID=A0AAD5D9L4_AMBAR|nr:hypothetical protein M8C21_014889 [Ambrosia artemisiifolia]